MPQSPLTKRLLWIVPVSLVVLYALAGLWLTMREEALVYPRSRDIDPLAFGVTRTPLTVLTNDGLRLSAWAMPDTVAAASKVWILFFHGNGGNVSTSMRFYAYLIERGIHVLAVDYRGYGQSEGDPTEPGLYLDANAAYECLVRQIRVPERNIIIYGQSLGGAVAIDLSTYAAAAGLVLEGTFSSLTELAQERYPIFPIQLLIKNRFDAISKVPRVRLPKLVVHSTIDDVVPFAHGRRLFDASPEPRRFLEVTGGHCNAYIQDEEKYFAGLSQFVQDVTGATLAVPHPAVTMVK